MDAMRAEYQEARAKRGMSGRVEYVNTAWCDCPEHRLPESLEPRGVADVVEDVADAA
ncbi:hypothetical protein LN042_28515 [Kitasatospora sp. RB6PN24]|uniref:hypothetical protein n=1 Tax=Kitasatospora humi TaxID=2893891 RepID=UPI001E484A6E|nr:hypothetical protein [Kitasatospora humi]MCC9310968.1 hypothetical protein [Kitasatospora humi]